VAAPPLTYLYCTQADVESILSSAGVLDRLDDEGDQYVTSTELVAMTDIITDASETVNFYAWSRYSGESLATSNWVKRRTAELAAYELCTRRGNPAPEAVEAKALAAQEMLSKVRDRNHPIPGIGLRRILAPAWSNIRCDARYNWKVIRVERGTSTSEPTQQTTQPQFIDRGEQYSYEI